MRFRGIVMIFKFCRGRQIRHYSLYYSPLRVRDTKEPKNLSEIPDVPKLWAKYKGLKINENNFKRLLLDELVNESEVKLDTPIHSLEKMFIIQSSIETLIKQDLVQDVNSVVNGLLSHLDSFPFDDTRIGQNEKNLSIRHIRNAIEKQYLAWKFKVPLEDIEEILHRYRLCLFEFRSMGNLRRNVSVLEKLPRASKLCVAEKIYHINQKPFHASSVGNFQDTIAGLNWQLFPQYCPKILQHSHQHILFVISTLRDLNFTEKQIQEGLPFLHLTFETLIRRLNHILENAETQKHRDHDKFLHLLSYNGHVLDDLINFRKASFLELTEMVSISSKTLTGRVRLASAKSILYHINQFYTIGSGHADLLKRHPKYRLVSEKQIHDTLVYLKSQNFKENEIAESLTVVLYPRNLIERTLTKINSEAETLQMYGYKNGCVPQQTHHFKHGTKEKHKVLQLCLYYLEKPFNFSGDGIWDCKADDEVDTVS